MWCLGLDDSKSTSTTGREKTGKEERGRVSVWGKEVMRQTVNKLLYPYGVRGFCSGQQYRMYGAILNLMIKSE